MTNLSGSYVISRLWHCYSECNSGTQNIVRARARVRVHVCVGEGEQPGQEESLCNRTVA